MCQIPGLLARDVQLLVGIGCRDTEAIAAYNAPTLTAMLQQYASTTAGQRVLRGWLGP